MLIKVSKKMVEELNKGAIKNGLQNDFTFEYAELSPEKYLMNVNDKLVSNDRLKNGKFKAIKTIYADEYFAVPYFLSTKELDNIFTEFKPQTTDEFVKAVFEVVAI